MVNYKKFDNELDFTGISFPVMLDDIPKFEKQNDLAISVYTIAEHGKQVYPILYTKRHDIDSINLLLIEGDEKFHYTWIKNFDRLLSYDPKNQNVLCPYCCYGFTTNWNGIENLRIHKLNCVRMIHKELSSLKRTLSILKKSQKCKRFLFVSMLLWNFKF